MTTLEDNILTFPQLCAIKREELGLTRDQVIRQSGFSGYHNFERGFTAPRRKTIKLLQRFFNISDEDMQKCRVVNNCLVRTEDQPAPVSLGVQGILKNLESFRAKIESLNLEGDIGKSIGEKLTEHLEMAQASTQELLILDRLR